MVSSASGSAAIAASDRATASDPVALSETTHQEIMEAAGAEAVELIMWLTMRGALASEVTRVHRNYYAPMTTGMGLITLTDAE